MNKNLIEEIELFIQYSVQEQERESALKSLRLYAKETIALQVLRDFYARTPEFREEAVTGISRIMSRHRSHLLSVLTMSHEYLYFYDGDQALYLGERKDGIGDTEILHFFGYTTNAAFLRQQVAPGVLMENAVFDLECNTFCPACSVPEGEVHHMGCPVEVCPWCEGQLTYCNCRFDKLGIVEIFNEADLEQLEIVLNEKGRIPFVKDQAPAYPVAGEDAILPE